MRSQTLPEADIAQVRRYCAERTSTGDQDQTRVECEFASEYVTIVELRAPWDPSSGAGWVRYPIARLNYDLDSQTWQLYYRDASARFHEYLRTAPSLTVDRLLEELDRNPMRVFWR
jgi:hypothetical protein